MSGTTVVAPEQPGRPAPRDAQARFRPELQGVRALASLLVVVYHVWLDRISGGVDVFFLVSGFLITGQLYRALLRGRIELRATWGRMIKRLFPAAMTVLLTVLVVSQLLLPADRWFQTIREVFASALFYENWQLAADSVDYFAQHNSASVVQHFWSLSIQGQFYLLWPILFVGLGLLVRRLGWSLRRTINVLLVVLFAASIAYSVYLTAVDQPLAYFHGLTRVWEFALGGLMAMFLDYVTLPRLLRIALGWIGVAGLVLCGIVLRVDSVFPGWIALWPTLSAALVLVAGQTGSRLGADRWLSSKPLGYLGNISFSLYLWHWPVLVFYLVARDRVAVGLLGGAVVLGVSFVLSVLTYHLIENPIRLSKIGTAKRWGAYRFGVLALAPVLIGSGIWQGVTSAQANFEIALDDPDHPGAVAQAPDFVYRGSATPSIVPPTLALPEDWAGITDDKCTISPRNQELKVCTQKPQGTPKKRVVLVGDSHIQQYIAAYLPLVQSAGWEVTSMLKGACPFSVTADLMPGNQGCIDWNKAAADEIVARHPDAVVTLASVNTHAGITETTPKGFVDQWSAMDRAGIPVVALRDNPRFGFNMAACVAQRSPEDPSCTPARASALPGTPSYTAVRDVPRNVSFLDFSDYFCEKTTCPAVVGNVLVYMDDNHVTATFQTTLAPIVQRDMQQALRW
ncbi:acyltransferase family protein [Amycolatopsis jiangsuensis]|uniref:Peptidoglycan/LPS O-acetylase OafA/YrhL n=1 Tax=Amycolatopsis jiangsuensis TaxID=1181879 RepID=A0A840IL90_9PSEU|nr:acyltransferase family protein [Amycolatopsis jiangsuensis]MBB4682760.1 peptidoglycan/LPS O-acetylase OafA/YrhL [Amycolatopsis jiangsuensis]